MPSFDFKFGGYKQRDTSSKEKKINPDYATVARKCPHCGRIYYKRAIRRRTQTVGKLYKKVFKDDE